MLQRFQALRHGQRCMLQVRKFRAVRLSMFTLYVQLTNPASSKMSSWSVLALFQVLPLMSLSPKHGYRRTHTGWI